MYENTLMRIVARVLLGVAAGFIVGTLVIFSANRLPGQVSSKSIIANTGEQATAAGSDLQVIDLGSGYRLAMDGSKGKVVAPDVPEKTSQVTTQRLDVGAGYTLVIDAEGGRIIPPFINEKKNENNPERLYLGSNYWLEMGLDGGKITSEGSK